MIYCTSEEVSGREKNCCHSLSSYAIQNEEKRAKFNGNSSKTRVLYSECETQSIWLPWDSSREWSPFIHSCWSKQWTFISVSYQIPFSKLILQERNGCKTYDKYHFKKHLGCTSNAFLSRWPKGSKLINSVCKMWHGTDFLSFKGTGSHS